MEKNTFLKVTFILLGISSLIGWNAVLSTFSYFSVKFGPRVFNGFTAPLQVGQCLFGVIMPWLATKLSLLTRIAGGLTILSILLVFLPILASIAPSDMETIDDELQYSNNAGYYIALVMTFFIGAFNSIAQNSMIALAAQQAGEINGLYWIATGLSGLSTAVLSLILNAAFHSMGDKGQYIATIIFFVFASLTSFTAIFLTYLMIKKYPAPHEQQEYDHEDFDQDKKGLVSETMESDISENQMLKSDDEASFMDKIKIAFAHVRFIPVFIFLIYLTTFTLFPGVMMNNVEFKGSYLSKDAQLWGTQFLNVTYQIGDVLGKTIGGNPIFHKVKGQYIAVLARLGFIATSLLVVFQQGAFFSNDWFPFVNMLLFATTNGFCTAGLMSLGPQKGQGKQKVIETIGFICGFALTFGIAMGSVTAIPFAEIVKLHTQ